MPTADRRTVVPVDAAAGEALVFSPDASGWARFFSPVYEGADTVRVRFGRESKGGAWVAREIFVTFSHRVSGRTLRDLPVGRMEAAVNRPEHHAALSGLLPAEFTVMLPWPEDVPTPGGKIPWWIKPPRLQPEPAPDLALAIPPTVRKPDSFYEEVAGKFAYLATRSTRPANELADANDVPVTTVHGWVKEARRRGLLPSGERSRRTG
jgi:hypothetical protein